ncbi:MAG: coenzyme F420-0:L-glutamate ligase [Candidatus Taylorbacteria bacterium]|nr:coenzyme F420-0:L-glutamate ligase [Candidatus Taylorbacteria bacterium]
MIIKPIKTRVFQEGEKLPPFMTRYFKTIPERSIIVVTSKIVSLSEKRIAIVKNVHTKERLIRGESQFALPTKHVWLTVKEGMVMASAGIDESNGNGKLILLPKDSFKTARLLRRRLLWQYRLKHLGVLITDSRTLPLCAPALPAWPSATTAFPASRTIAARRIFSAAGFIFLGQMWRMA